MSRPTTVTVSFIIWFIVVVLNIVQGIISLVNGDAATAANSMGMGSVVVSAIISFIIALVELFIVFRMRDGRNWARIVLLVLAILQLIGAGVGAASGAGALGWIGGIVVLVATILMFVGTRGYFRKA